MKSSLSIPAVCFFLALLFSGNTDSPDILYWSPDYKLTWEDFKGTPAYESRNISALTSSGIVHYAGCKEGKIIYKVQAYFEKNESWVKSEALTNHHLTHEQIHFDITELNARKLRQALSEKQFRCGEEWAFEYFVANFLERWETQQKHYDIMTQHSLNEEQQEEWYHKVQAELFEMQDFAE